MKLALALTMAGLTMAILWAALLPKLMTFDEWTNITNRSLIKKDSFKYWRIW